MVNCSPVVNKGTYKEKTQPNITMCYATSEIQEWFNQEYQVMYNNENFYWSFWTRSIWEEILKDPQNSQTIIYPCNSIPIFFKAFFIHHNTALTTTTINKYNPYIEPSFDSYEEGTTIKLKVGNYKGMIRLMTHLSSWVIVKEHKIGLSWKCGFLVVWIWQPRKKMMKCY